MTKIYDAEGNLISDDSFWTIPPSVDMDFTLQQGYIRTEDHEAIVELQAAVKRIEEKLDRILEKLG